MGNYTILSMFENPRRGRQARNFTTNAPKILDLKSSSEQIFSLKLPLGAPAIGTLRSDNGDGNGNVRSLGRAGPRRVGVPAKIEITNFTSENVDDGH